MLSQQAQVHAFFDSDSNTFSYIVEDCETKKCALIDSVTDYDAKSGRTSYASADAIIEKVTELGLEVEWIMDTHIHADHLSAAPYLRQQLGGKMAIGKDIVTVQNVFGKLFNAGPDFPRDGSQFDVMLDDGECFKIGNIDAKAIHTPGHTPACMSYVIGDAVFVGDTLFMPDYGTARCDFPGGSAEKLFDSVQKIFELPDETRMFLCHDYGTPEREEYAFQTTVGEQKRNNIHVRAGTSKEEFVTWRTERDATLDMPRLILPSVQVNMRAGDFPPPEDNGVRYLKIPLNEV